MATTLPAAADAATSAGATTPSKEGDSKPDSSWWAMLKQTGADWMEDKAMRLAAALALYAILSLGPLMVIALKVIAMVLGDEAASKQLEGQLTQLMGADLAKTIQGMIAANSKEGAGVVATTVSVGLLLFTATGVIGELQDAMNTIWEVKPKANQGVWGFIRTRLLSAGMIVGIAFLLLTSMFVSTLVTTMAEKIAGKENAWLGFAIDAGLSLAVVTVLFAAIFKFLPDVKTQWRDVWTGAAFTAALFIVGKYALAFYFAKAAPTSAFGAAGSLVALLLWIYYTSMILFFGAEFTQVYAKAHGRWIEPDDHAVKVTTEERAQQGMVSNERLEAATAGTLGKSKMRTPSFSTPAYAAYAHQAGKMRPQDYKLTAGGVALGAVVGALGLQYFRHDPKKPTRKHLAAVGVEQRLAEIEKKIGRASRIHEYLQDVSVAERIQKVERDIQRAGRHVRANQTGRPLWMVRLADLVGGRWSNL